METIQILGIPIMLIGIYISKWGLDDLKKEKIDWYATARDFGTAFFTILLGILMIFNKVQF
jgi:hypothetical protein